MTRCLALVLLLAPALAGCATFPELDARIPAAERAAPPPALLPLAPILAAAAALPAAPPPDDLLARAAGLAVLAVPAPARAEDLAEDLEARAAALEARAAALRAPAAQPPASP